MRSECEWTKFSKIDPWRISISVHVFRWLEKNENTHVFLNFFSGLSTPHIGIRAKTGPPRFRIMCLCKVVCLTADFLWASRLKIQLRVWYFILGWQRNATLLYNLVPEKNPLFTQIHMHLQDLSVKITEFYAKLLWLLYIILFNNMLLSWICMKCLTLGIQQHSINQSKVCRLVTFCYFALEFFLFFVWGQKRILLVSQILSDCKNIATNNLIAKPVGWWANLVPFDQGFRPPWWCNGKRARL